MNYESGDHQTADQGCVSLCCCRSSPCARAWTVQSINCTPALSVTQKRCCSCGMRLVALY